MKLPGIRSRKIAPATSSSGDPSAPPQGAPKPLLPHLLHRNGSWRRSDADSVGRVDSEASSGEGVTREDFEVLKLLGRGGFGEVKLVKCNRDGQLYAMKAPREGGLRQALEKSAVLERRHLGDDGARGRVQAERDLGVMTSQWKCPFIVEMYAAFQTHDKLYFIFEYCPQGDLFERLLEQPNRRFEEPAVRFYIAELSLALGHLHARGAVHRDVKLENALLGSNGHVKLADFGIAKMDVSPEGARPSYAFGEGCSLAFYPPEFRRGEAYGKDLDCWQLGVAAFLMLSGGLPDPDSPSPPPGASRAAADLCARLLEPERARRLGHPDGAGQLRGHGFFRGLDWRALEALALTPPGPPSVAAQASGASTPGSPMRPTLSIAGRISGLFRLPRFTFSSPGLLRRGRAEPS